MTATERVMTTSVTMVLDDARYRTSWRRIGAAVVDGLLLAALGFLVVWAGAKSRSPALLVTLYLVNSGAALGYSIVLHGMFGQTVGKMATRVKVVSLSESDIGLERAAWRDSPWLLLAAIDAVWGTATILGGRNPFLLQIDGWVPAAVGFASLAWCLAELVTMLTNRRRRAIHDWIAGTVVVRL